MKSTDKSALEDDFDFKKVKIPFNFYSLMSNGH